MAVQGPGGPAARDAEARGLALGVPTAIALAVGPAPFGAGALGCARFRGAGLALAAVGRRRALSALRAHCLGDALRDAPVVARQVALPPPGGDLMGHDGLLSAKLETEEDVPLAPGQPPDRVRARSRAGDNGPAGRPWEEGISPSACGHREGRPRPNPRLGGRRREDRAARRAPAGCSESWPHDGLLLTGVG